MNPAQERIDALQAASAAHHAEIAQLHETIRAMRTALEATRLLNAGARPCSSTMTRPASRGRRWGRDWSRCVNLAARLASACMQYGARILISEFTYRALRGTYRTREVDIVVKGKPGRF